MNQYYNNRFGYKRKNNKYLEGFTKRLAVVAVIFISMFTVKITYIYNGNTALFKLEKFYRKDYTLSIKNIATKNNFINVFSNKFSINEKKSFKLEFMPIEGQISKSFGEYIDANTKKAF
ncbi:hypothetical protein PL321_15590 [Caloramator sp. mosi_1]|uniref:hypothetical protein n=1 Tax=Caloramator sp. mosi_1 TaxID=3023090 RepID=UPI00235DEB9C|nr:hypothetical protein [Caloramator sp. mosi_1]WDC83870.1 hypothetical protein PL321_15590 [Caloramator sp. mosi_1]